jgi:hypothetical protein
MVLDLARSLRVCPAEAAALSSGDFPCFPVYFQSHAKKSNYIQDYPGVTTKINYLFHHIHACQTPIGAFFILKGFAKDGWISKDCRTSF